MASFFECLLLTFSLVAYIILMGVLISSALESMIQLTVRRELRDQEEERRRHQALFGNPEGKQA